MASLPPLPDPKTRPTAAIATGIESWSDGAKVALLSGLTIPFATLWYLRIVQIEHAPTLSTYVSRAFIPTLRPFLAFQLASHVALFALGLALRARPSARALVLAEVQLWCGCLAFSLYAVGVFTHPWAVLLMVCPSIGYLLFDAKLVHTGLVTLVVGLAIGIALPLLGLAPYGPFLAHAPYADGRLEPMWVVSTGIPTLFAAGVGVFIHLRLVQRLRDRQRELEWRSSVDSLTGVWNRAVFFTRLEEEVARARRHGLSLSVLMIDVDHFKAVNDEYGHAVGDRVLRELATKLREALRTGDVAARYGGEELAVLLPHTKLEPAAMVADRLVAAAHQVVLGAGKRLTVSVGLAELRGDETPDALVARADAALYVAKRDGRDRIAKAAA